MRKPIIQKLATGTVEIVADTLTVLGKAPVALPFEIATSKETKEEVRLKYRFLDLRNKKVHDNIVLRSQVISFLRNKMTELGFLELQTPILSASSPEGARDYLIPSRKHKGMFYALPQAPQIFKQLLRFLALISISRLHLASEMRTQEQIVHQVNSTSSILKWLLQNRTMFLQ